MLNFGSRSDYPEIQNLSNKSARLLIKAPKLIRNRKKSFNNKTNKSELPIRNNNIQNISGIQNEGIADINRDIQVNNNSHQLNSENPVDNPQFM